MRVCYAFVRLDMRFLREEADRSERGWAVLNGRTDGPLGKGGGGPGRWRRRVRCGTLARLCSRGLWQGGSRDPRDGWVCMGRSSLEACMEIYRS